MFVFVYCVYNNKRSAGLQRVQRVINTWPRLSSLNTLVLWVQSSSFVAWVLPHRPHLRLHL